MSRNYALILSISVINAIELVCRRIEIRCMSKLYKVRKKKRKRERERRRSLICTLH